MDDKLYFQSVKHLEQYHEKERQFREEKLKELPDRDASAVKKEATMLIQVIKAGHPRVPLSVDGILEAAIAALYFAKFGESPTATAIKANIKK